LNSDIRNTYVTIIKAAYTSSKVSGFYATVSVSYENECAGDSIGTAVFENQIVIENKRSSFLAGGDSGSLMVENVATNPWAVGLLFAGSRSTAVANPIDDVLDTFGVTMVGEPGSGASSTQTSSSTISQKAQIASANAAQKRASASLMNKGGVVGHGIGLGANGQYVIKVYVESLADYDRGGVPPFIDGVRVVVEETGKIVAF
jgi:hypothetical protein